MMKLRTSLVFCVAMLFLIPALLPAQGQPKYVGANACKACHLTPKSGAAFKIWQESKHAKAIENLAGPAAKEIGQKKGIADPQKSDACLKCHDTAFGMPSAQLAPTFKPGEGVGCEVCHGPGSEYKAMQVMKDITAGKIKGETVGLMKPDEKVCLKCHNSESPTFKGFNFAEYVKKVAHPKPKQ